MKKYILLILSVFTALTAYPASQKVILPDSVKVLRDSLFIEGLRYKHLDNSDSTIIMLEKADSIDPGNSAICYELGMGLMKTDFDKAYQYLQKAAELSSGNYYYQKTLIQAHLKNGDKQAAIKAYESIVKRYPDHEGDIFSLAELYSTTGDYKNAIKTFEKLERLIGVDRYVSMSKINVYLAQNNIKQALKEIDDIIKAMPLDATLWVYKGGILMDNKEMDEAYKCFEKSLEIEPENGYALEYLYVYYIRIGEMGEAEKIMYRIFATENVQFDSKKEYLKSLIQYYQVQNIPYSKLDTVYKTIINADSDNSQARLLYADYLLQVQRRDDAIEELQSAIYVNSQCQQCWEYLLYYVSESKDSVKVEKVLSDARDAIPESADFYYYSGIWSFAKNNEKMALSYMLKADSIVSNVQNGELSQANKKDMWNFLMSYYRKTGNKEKTYYYLDKVAKEFPKDIGGLNNYAYIMAEDNIDLDKAEKMSKTTIDKEPLNSMYLDTYAYILMKQGKLTYAKFYAEQAMEYMYNSMSESEMSVIISHYGDILFKLGDKEGAVAQWKKALEKAEDSDKPKLEIKIMTKEYVE